MGKAVVLAEAVQLYQVWHRHQMLVALELLVKVLQAVLASTFIQFGRKVAVAVAQVLSGLMALNLAAQAEMVGWAFQVQFLVLLFSTLAVAVEQV